MLNPPIFGLHIVIFYDFYFIFYFFVNYYLVYLFFVLYLFFFFMYLVHCVQHQFILKVESDKKSQSWCEYAFKLLERMPKGKHLQY